MHDFGRDVDLKMDRPEEKIADVMPEEKDRQRILLTLSYDGTAYAGWQRQENAMSVQQCVEEALQKLTGERTAITGAGRTDAGVHALDQRAHFDTISRIPPEKYSFALNSCLPMDIRVLASKAVDHRFHARFDAQGKLYTYRIHNATHASALYRCFRAHVPMPLDMEAMERSLFPLVGTHDFAAFQAAGSTVKTTVRTISQLDLAHRGDEITLTIQGNGFLYNMVRIIAGTMIEIGQHRLAESAFAHALETKNRRDLGMTAPACGLELSRVFYGEGE